MTDAAGGRTPTRMTLAQRAEDGLLALTAMASRHKSEDEERVINAACDQAEKYTRALDEIARTADELTTRGLDVTLPPFPRGNHITNLRATATRLLTLDASDGLANRLRQPTVQDALRAAESLVKKRETLLRNVAEAERVRLAQDAQGPITSLPGRESLQAQAKRVQSALAKAAPPTVADLPEAVDRWRSAAAEWKQTTEEIDRAVTELPIELRAFIEAAASDAGADWSLLTPEVRAWLDTASNGDGYVMHKW